MKNMTFININFKDNGEELCMADSVTTHTILRDKKNFSSLTLIEANVNTIIGITNLIKGSRRANIIFSEGIKFIIYDTLFPSNPEEIY